MNELIGQNVVVGLINGETVRGKLTECDNYKNLFVGESCIGERRAQRVFLPALSVDFIALQ